MSDAITIKRFMSLFVGLDRAHGKYHNGRARTVKKKAGPSSYQKHLDGTVGLGLTPILSNNKCLFGAIDIDINDIDHAELETKTKKLDLPAITCRSKSGGAHVYTFFQSPGVPAPIVRNILSGWASSLGFGDSEIFPKQDRLGEGELGNWINLPYFNAQESERYAFKNGQPCDLTTFLDMADAIRNTNTVDADSGVKDHEGYPPCLLHATQNGIPDGHRNEILFSLAVYLKRRDPDTWEDELSKANYSLCEKPLSRQELEKIIKSVRKKDYGYRCEEEFSKQHCDRLRCQQLKFGVGKVKEVYSELLIGCLTKVTTDPPKWLLDFNGIDVEMTTEQLMSYKYIRILALERLNLVVPPMKPEDWLQVVRQKLTAVKEIEAPDDASATGQLYSMFDEFLRLSDRNRLNGRGTLLRGVPIKDTHKNQPVIFFRSQDFAQFLRRKKFGKSVANSDLWMKLRNMGCDHTKIKVDTKAVQVWMVPRDADDAPVINELDITMEDDF